MKLLVLCLRNSARSILLESILNHEGNGRVTAYSAGSRPAGRVHPAALSVLSRLGHDVTAARSKSWDEFTGPDAPHLDFVFTVCDRAAAEECPFWPGQPMTAHWGVPDPAAVEGSDAVIREAFAETYRTLTTRLSAFVNLPLATLDGLSLQKELDQIGKTSHVALDPTQP